jgi:predicted nucleic acid-binding protein
VGLLRWNRGDTIYLDTDVVIYGVERIAPYHELLLPLWTAANAGEVKLAGSDLLLLETMVKPLREGNIVLQNAFRQFLTQTSFKLAPISRLVLESAAQLRVNAGLKTPDSIHAATALLENCSGFLTNDKGFLRVDGLPVIVLDSVLAG